MPSGERSSPGSSDCGLDECPNLAPTAVMLALVQTATTLPGLFLGVPAGALADVIDRRQLLVAASAWMLAVSALLAITTVAHLTSSWWLLRLTFGDGRRAPLAAGGGDS